MALERQKHAQETAHGDDVTYFLEKDRERLSQQVYICVRQILYLPWVFFVFHPFLTLIIKRALDGKIGWNEAISSNSLREIESPLKDFILICDWIIQYPIHLTHNV